MTGGQNDVCLLTYLLKKTDLIYENEKYKSS